MMRCRRKWTGSRLYSNATNIFKEESNVTVTIGREVPDLDYILESAE